MPLRIRLTNLTSEPLEIEDGARAPASLAMDQTAVSRRTPGCRYDEAMRGRSCDLASRSFFRAFAGDEPAPDSEARLVHSLPNCDPRDVREHHPAPGTA
jgi:hypothetical protein